MVAPTSLEAENHKRDADFNKAMHGQSAGSRGGLMSMMAKGASAKALSVEEYFKHWDNQASKDETPEIREKRRAMYASLTREYYVSRDFITKALTHLDTDRRACRTSRPTCTSTAGLNPSISAASHTESRSDRHWRDTNTIWHTSWASKRT